MDANKLKEIMVKENLTWRSFSDPPNDKNEGFRGPIAERWNVDGTPTLYMVDHQGVIRHHWVGSPGTKAIDESLAKLIKEAETAGKQDPK